MFHPFNYGLLGALGIVIYKSYGVLAAAELLLLIPINLVLSDGLELIGIFDYLVLKTFISLILVTTEPITFDLISISGINLYIPRDHPLQSPYLRFNIKLLSLVFKLPLMWIFWSMIGLCGIVHYHHDGLTKLIGDLWLTMLVLHHFCLDMPKCEQKNEVTFGDLTSFGLIITSLTGTLHLAIVMIAVIAITLLAFIVLIGYFDQAGFILFLAGLFWIATSSDLALIGNSFILLSTFILAILMVWSHPLFVAMQMITYQYKMVPRTMPLVEWRGVAHNVKRLAQGLRNL